MVSIEHRQPLGRTVWKWTVCTLTWKTNRNLKAFKLNPLKICGSHQDVWWRVQIEPFFVLLAFCAGNLPVTGEFSAQRPVTRSFDVFYDLRLNKWLSKQSWGSWFEAPSRSLWRHFNDEHGDYDIWSSSTGIDTRAPVLSSVTTINMIYKTLHKYRTTPKSIYGKKDATLKWIENIWQKKANTGLSGAWWLYVDK